MANLINGPQLNWGRKGTAKILSKKGNLAGWGFIQRNEVADELACRVLPHIVGVINQ